MEQCSSPIVLLLLIELLLQLLIQTSNSQLLPIVDDVLGCHGTQVYIIDVQRHEQHSLLNDGDLESFHRSFLTNFTLGSGEPWLVLYSYHHVFSVFAARLTPGELEVVKSKPDFLYAQCDRRYHLATTGLSLGDRTAPSPTGSLPDRRLFFLLRARSQPDLADFPPHPQARAVD
ncbi:subtilisin-like protease SBT3.1 [Dendrobium catenatum]|uniref:subtilisin-like protease SBT3.1 n=1 Tax=Dendrobium catenatum TaxID=906689 RepID=UPI00109F8AAC|nr:subtilisin-like protease SBT3.1 [Dendrobium catenatum]